MARVRIIYSKLGLFTFVNHMDLPRIFSRSARRAGLVMEYTRGFSPRPRISLASPLAIGVEGLYEPADFWFCKWDENSCRRWSEMLPDGLKILKYAEVEDGMGLAKLIDAATYRVIGADFSLDENTAKTLADAATRLNALFNCSFEDGTVNITVGDLERCGAGQLVKSLIAAGLASGWQDLHIARIAVGKWDEESSSVLPLI